eukprot:4768619-Prymnesium_polylepis.1
MYRRVELENSNGSHRKNLKILVAVEGTRMNVISSANGSARFNPVTAIARVPCAVVRNQRLLQRARASSQATEHAAKVSMRTTGQLALRIKRLWGQEAHEWVAWQGG